MRQFGGSGTFTLISTCRWTSDPEVDSGVARSLVRQWTHAFALVYGEFGFIWTLRLRWRGHRESDSQLF